MATAVKVLRRIKLPQPREFLANNIPSRAIEQANQEFRQDDRHSQHAYASNAQ